MNAECGTWNAELKRNLQILFSAFRIPHSASAFHIRLFHQFAHLAGNIIPLLHLISE
jgi:hypothetical protein